MLERDKGSIPRQRFKDLCLQRFGPPLRSKFLGEATCLHFVSTVEDCKDRFLALICHADPPLVSCQQVQLFTAGLPGRLRVDVKLCSTVDLQQAMVLAQSYNRRQQGSDDRAPQSSTRLLIVPSSTSTERLIASSSTSAERTTATSAPTAPTFKRLTLEEMAERRHQGLCYNCDELFVRGHHCQHLFYLEVPADNDWVGAAEDPPPRNPDFQLKDKLFLEARRDVMTGNPTALIKSVSLFRWISINLLV
jgi:hypothetical protein